MGKLVEQKIPTLFGGVSRQPVAVRQPNQVEAMTNALASVVTGGFEKRPSTQTLAKLSFLSAAASYHVHPIDRDETEQTFLLFGNDEIKAVNAITGAEITVNTGDSTRYFLIDNDNDLTQTRVVQDDDGNDIETQLTIDSSETTFAWEWSTSDAATLRFKVEGSADGAIWNDIQTGIGGAASGSFNTTIGAVATNDHNYIRVTVTTGAAASTDTLTVKATFKDLTYLLNADPEDVRAVSVADNTFVINRNVTALRSELGTGSIAGTQQTFSDLPAATGSGDIQRVQGDDVDGFGTFYVKDDSTSTWVETADPTQANGFAPNTMPHRVVREADGTFTFKAADWDERAAGDDTVSEPPNFIGKKIKEITFFRNRLVLCADESVTLSEAANVFNFWPQKAVEVLDNDPIDRAATANSVNILEASAVFRKILFLTSGTAQFEMTSDAAFSPTTAELDQATTYIASPLARPSVMGDVLYFASASQSDAIIYEYFFDEATLSNTAADVSKHALGFLPTDVLEIRSDSTTSTVFVLSTGEQNSVFIYRTFFDGAQKLQSAWGKYTFGASESAAFVHGMAVFSGFLVLVIERDDGSIYLEQMPIERELQDPDIGFTPFLDQRELGTGSYDSGTDVTTWDLTYEHGDDAQVILGPAFSEAGRELNVVYPEVFTLTLASVAAGETLILSDGTTSQTYTAHATTTTTANREFDISGNDTADAGELATVINDATDGHPTISAVDNGDGTLTITADNEFTTSINTPTGTAVTNATIAVVETDSRVAAEGDFSAGQSYLGRPYTMTVEFSKFFIRDNAGTILNGRVMMKDLIIQYADTGFFRVQITPAARDAFTVDFEGKELGDEDLVIGSSSVRTQGEFVVPLNTEGDTAKVEIINAQPSPCIITAAAWRGMFNELSRQEA